MTLDSIDAPLAQRARKHVFSYNPFFLLSAMCMLVGLFSLNNSLDWSPLPKHNLLWLICILNVYEFLLIGIGIFLARRGLFHDAATLFVLEAFFLVDAGFLNSEIFATDFTLGMIVNTTLMVLAAAKVGMVFVGLRLPMSDTRYALILAQMLVLLTIPGFFKQVADQNNAVLPPAAIYAAWWVVGVLPVLYVLLHRENRAYWHRGIVGTFVLLPAVSILAHLCTSNWVYHVRWTPANVAPLLLGLSIAAGACDHHVRNVTARMRLQLLLPLGAIVLSRWAPDHLSADIGATITPLRLALLGATVVYMHGLWLHRHPYFAAAGLLCLGSASLGDSPESMSQNVNNLAQRGASTMWRFVPTTAMAWGLVSVVASFVLLGLGVALSLLRARGRTLPAESGDNHRA
jgi:hypothetical protein